MLEQENYQVDQLTLLKCNELDLKKEDSGFITLNYKGDVYKKVQLTRLIPFYSKTTYISISYENSEKEFREIGVIKDMSELSVEQYKLLDDYLEFKYYMPEIKKVDSIKDVRAYFAIQAETTSGKKEIRVRDLSSNFKMISKEYLYVVDLDGNKYFIPDIYKLDKKSIANIELFA
jgi:hypothetical protein